MIQIALIDEETCLLNECRLAYVLLQMLKLILKRFTEKKKKKKHKLT